MEMDYSSWLIAEDCCDLPIEDPQELKRIIIVLAKEIDHLNNQVNALKSFIPVKYKKFCPKTGENPFFSSNDIKPTQEDFEGAKKRMADLIEKFRPETLD